MAAARQIWGWLGRWGFAAAVACALGLAISIGIGVEVPVPTPGFALQAAVAYRAEVAATVFGAAYLGLVTFALALNNRGSTEIGTTGISARSLSESEAGMKTVARNEELADLRQNAVDKPKR